MSIMHGIEYVGYVDPWTDEERLSDEEIVRCMDCKHAQSPRQGLPWMCARNCCSHVPIGPDGFCAWSEKKRVD